MTQHGRVNENIHTLAALVRLTVEDVDSRNNVPINIPINSPMLGHLNAALRKNAFSLVPQSFSINAASGGLKAALKMDRSNGMI